MSYWTSAVFKMSDKEQIEAAKKYDYHSVLIPEQKIEDIMQTDDIALHIVFDGLNLYDFDELIPAFSKYLAAAVPGKNFSCEDAICQYSVSHSLIEYQVIYKNNHLTVRAIHEGDGWDEYYGNESIKEIALIPPYKFIKRFELFVFDAFEGYEYNCMDHITADTDLIVTNLDPDHYTEEIKKAVKKNIKVVDEEDFLTGFALWGCGLSERPWEIVIDEDVRIIR